MIGYKISIQSNKSALVVEKKTITQPNLSTLSKLSIFFMI